MDLKINITIIITLLITIYAVDRVRCVCDSNTLRDMAVEACNRITKRSVDLNDFYNVEHIYPKNSLSHRHALAKKLTHRDFPKGAYLLIHGHKKYDNTLNEDYSDEIDNSVLTEDMQGLRNHKNRHSLRFRRNAVDTFTIEHCCSKANLDVCGRYFCH